MLVKRGLIVLYLTLIFVESIFVPDNNRTDVMKHLGIKTIQWQPTNSNKSLEMHHNYSKISVQTSPNTKPTRINDQIESQFQVSEEYYEQSQVNTNGNEQEYQWLEGFSQQRQDDFGQGQLEDFGQQQETSFEVLETANSDNSHQNNNGKPPGFKITTTTTFEQFGSQNFGSNKFPSQTPVKPIYYQSRAPLKPAFDHQRIEQFHGKTVGFSEQHGYGHSQQSVPNQNTQKVVVSQYHEGYQHVTEPKRIIIRRPKSELREPEVYSKCPPGSTGQYVYELSCNQFLNCWKGRGIVQNCAPGTLFNPQSLECDYADKVECISGPSRASFQFSKPAQLVQASCPSDFTGIIPHYTNCSKFITCNHGKEIEMDCPPGTLFDIKTNNCDYPYKSQCVFSQSKRQASGYTNMENFPQASSWSYIHRQIQQGEKPNPHFGKGKNMKGHYIVREQHNINDHLSEFNGGSSQNSYNRQEYGRNYDQQEVHNHQGVQPPKRDSNYGNSYGQTGTNNAELDNSYCEGKSGLQQHPFDCSKFIQCANGQITIQDCGPGTLFNHILKLCDHEINVDCAASKQAANYASSVSSNRNIEEVRCPEYETGLQPHPYDCSKFLNCANGKTYIQDCGPGTVFNPSLKVCDFPYRVDCSGIGKIIQTGENNYGPSSHNVNGYDQRWDQHQGSTNQGTNKWGSSTHPPITRPSNQPKPGYSGQNVNGYDQRWDQHQESTNQGTNKWGSSTHRPLTRPSNPPQPGYPGQNVNGYDQRWDQHQESTNQGTNKWGSSTHRPLTRPSNQPQPGYPGQNVNGYDQRWDQHQESTNQGTNKWGSSTHPTLTRPSNQQKPGYADQSTNQWSSSTFRPLVKPTSNQHQIGQSGIYGYEYQGSSTNQPINVWRPSYLNPTAGQVNQGGQNQNTGSGYRPNQTGGHYYPQNTGNTGENLVGSSTNIHHNIYDQTSGFQPQSTNKQWPPPFPSTDLNADYVFEDYDETTEQEATQKDKFDKTKCTNEDFKCGPNECVPPSLVCNAKRDCANGIDEMKCDKYLESFSFLAGNRLARLEEKKLLNVTLATCAKYCFETKIFKCKAFNYRKMDGACFLLTTNVGLSGGLILMNNYDYFELKTETIDCSSKFLCSDKKCIDLPKVCDGNNYCIDRADEKYCSADKIGYKLKLAGSKNRNEGRLEVTVLGKTGYVCDDKFGMRNAEVVCKELGFEMGALEVKGNSYFTNDMKENDTLYLMDDITCLGNETSLKDCDFNGWGVSNCLDQEIVGVICKTPQDKCQKDYWRCDTKNECIPMVFVCDGVEDCQDKSDERPQNCEAPIGLRLVGGKAANEGRVEVKYHNTWGTICDDDFNDDAAKVVCKYLGYTGKGKVVKDGHFGPGDGPIWLDQVYCKGNESSLEDCSHWNWGEHNCEHSEDVGVICGLIETPQVQRNINRDIDQINQVLEEDYSTEQISSKGVYPERCGLRSDALFDEVDDIHFRVVKGTAAKRGEYPWQASIRVKGKSSKQSHWCGAVIISSKFILTAAHCLKGFPKGSFSIVAGDYDVDEDEGTEQEAFIEEHYIHEDFRKGGKMNNDIAVVKLKGRGFVLTKAVQAICLPDKEIKYQHNTNCTISGFGSTQTGKSSASHILRAGWVPMQNNDICKMPHVYGDTITEGMFCAGSLDEGVDACDGDSGGPLACLNEGYFTLYGLTSWGQHCGYANKPGVYVRVAHYRDWIDSTIRKHLNDNI